VEREDCSTNVAKGKNKLWLLPQVMENFSLKCIIDLEKKIGEIPDYLWLGKDFLAKTHK
jgi:hypothetical protein